MRPIYKTSTTLSDQIMEITPGTITSFSLFHFYLHDFYVRAETSG